jgi:transcriptional regulator with XRE-family HTH domain
VEYTLVLFSRTEYTLVLFLEIVKYFMTDAKKIIGSKIKELRQSRKMFQKNFGEIFGQAPKSTVSSWENGIYLPSENTLKAIANYFDVSMDYLYGNETGHHSPQPAVPPWLAPMLPDLASLAPVHRKALKAFLKALKTE